MPYIGKSPIGGGFHKLDALTASSTATYALTLGSAAYYPETANQLLVSLNGVIQAPQDSFTVSGSNLVFDSALTSSDSIDFVVALGDVLGVGSVTDGAVTANKIGTDAVTTAKINDGAVTSAKLDTNIAITGNLSASGIITASAQPAFRAVSTGSWTIPHNTQTIFPANSAVFNIGSGYNTGTYKFTAPVDGVYYFYGQFFASVAPNRGIASIFKNDAQAGGSQTLYLGSTSNGGISYATQSMMQLSAGDTASFYTYQESGGTVTANQSSHLSFWYGYLLG